MAAPQPGIFAEGSVFHHFLEYDVKSPDGVAAVVACALASADTVNVVVAFGAALWTKLGAGAVPADLRAFNGVVGAGDAAGRNAPATQRDMMVWVHGADRSDVFDLAMSVNRAMGAAGTLVLDLPGFMYHDSRDLTGFVDGSPNRSANPVGEDRAGVALIPDGQPGAGGAYVMSQKWIHDLESFRVLPEGEQEGVIGRTKPDSIELEGDAMPPDSHVSRTDVKVDGVAYKMYRRSAPYGTVSERGLYFLAFTCDPIRFDVALDRMYGVAPDGVHDRLIDYTDAVTGSYWFAPSQEALEAVGR